LENSNKLTLLDEFKQTDKFNPAIPNLKP